MFQKRSSNVFMLFWEHYERPDNSERSVTGRTSSQSSEDIPCYMSRYEFMVICHATVVHMKYSTLSFFVF